MEEKERDFNFRLLFARVAVENMVGSEQKAIVLAIKNFKKYKKYCIEKRKK
jgi:hypothetical protein